MKDYYTKQQEKYKLYGLNRKDIIALHNHLCEITPSVAEDSGQAEWTTDELDEFILTMLSILKQNYIPKDRLSVEKIEEIIDEEIYGIHRGNHMLVSKQNFKKLATKLFKELKKEEK